MRTSSVLYVYLSLFVFASCGGTKKITKPVTLNAWQFSSIVVDGNADDWSGKHGSHIDDKAPFETCVANDKERLYVLLKTSDRIIMSKMMIAGMQFWIDVSGKKREDVGIRFPMEADEPFKMSKYHLSDQHREDPRFKKNDASEVLIKSAREYAVQGFAGCAGAYMVNQSNKCGIVVRIGTNDANELIWEASIPFSSFLKDTLVKEDLGKKLSICFEVNSVKAPEGSGSPEVRIDGRARRMGESDGRMGVGGMSSLGDRPFPGGNSGGNREQLFEVTKVWQTIYLAYNE